MTENPGLLITLVGFALVLGPLVFIHELGHYLVGRWFGVAAESFSIGFGKEVFGWTDRHGTRWKLSALPLGGYVKFAGDIGPAGQSDAEWLALPPERQARTFQAKPLWQRSLIVLAGPAINLLFAMIILAGFNLAYGKLQAPPVIGTVEVGSIAEKAGLQVGDRIVSIRGSAVHSFLDVRLAVGQNPGEDMGLVIEGDGRRLTVPARAGEKRHTDRFGNVERIGYLGIGTSQVQLVPLGPVDAVVSAFDQTRDIMGMMVTGIGQIVTGRRSVEELGGPIRIAKYSGEQLVSGIQSYVWFVALISINLGFINLLPIPLLDGGHLAFYAAEAIRRKPVSARGQEWAFRTGLAFVMAMMLLATANDIVSLRLFAS